MIELNSQDSSCSSEWGLLPLNLREEGGQLNKIRDLVGKRRMIFCNGLRQTVDSRTADTKAGWWVSNTMLCERQRCYTVYP